MPKIMVNVAYEEGEAGGDRKQMANAKTKATKNKSHPYVAKTRDGLTIQHDRLGQIGA